MMLFLAGCSRLPKKIELTAASTTADEGHLSANDFSRMVGQALQNNYPAMVKNPTVSISAKVVGNKTIYTYYWSCEIVPCIPSDADRHFDRRGTIYGSSTLEQAKLDVVTDITKTQKVQKMMNGFDTTYGSHFMPEKFITKISFFDPTTSIYWYMEEYFCTSKHQ